tara:strand:+ start:14833 stop:15651 length:819 start_codon:yes stop_codon:yes gene_type:complete
MSKLQGQPRQGSVGILISARVQIPHLDATTLSRLNSHKTKVVTRHFSNNEENRLLEKTLNGSFKFGTIVGYRPADEAQIGRFSDLQEGLQRDVFRSRDGTYNAEIGGIDISKSSMIGIENPLVHQVEVNEYCSCSSRGSFDLERAKVLRERDNPDLNAYVVYDLVKLLTAIKDIVAESKERENLRIVAREVQYGDKDRSWEIDGRINFGPERDHLDDWLNNIFVKSTEYCPEDELRIILLDPARAGLLSNEERPYILNDDRIASAIIDFGNF